MHEENRSYQKSFILDMDGVVYTGSKLISGAKEFVNKLQQGNYIMFHWLADHRRKKILEKNFPAEWRLILQKYVLHYLFLNDDERIHLEQLVQVFAEEKIFTGCNGLEVTDEIRVVISAEACMLLLGLPHDLYDILAGFYNQDTAAREKNHRLKQ